MGVRGRGAASGTGRAGKPPQRQPCSGCRDGAGRLCSRQSGENGRQQRPQRFRRAVVPEGGAQVPRETGPGGSPPSAGTPQDRARNLLSTARVRPPAVRQRPGSEAARPTSLLPGARKDGRAETPGQRPVPNAGAFPVSHLGSRRQDTPRRLPLPAPSAAAGLQRGGGEARSPHSPPAPLPDPPPAARAPPAHVRRPQANERCRAAARRRPSCLPRPEPPFPPPAPGRDPPRGRAAVGGEEENQGHRVLGFHLDYRPCFMGAEQGRLPPAGPDAGVSARERKAQEARGLFFFPYIFDEDN